MVEESPDMPVPMQVPAAKRLEEAAPPKFRTPWPPFPPLPQIGASGLGCDFSMAGAGFSKPLIS